ncbi:MAG: hypothetical protein ACM31L_05735 [Actinomycetota bacterium]
MSHIKFPLALGPEVTFSMTSHALARCRQRAVREADMGLFMQHASHMEGGVYVMTAANVDAAVAALKREISAVERMRGVTAVVIGGRVVTVYRDAALLQGGKSRRQGKRHFDKRVESDG